jgi:hypothetical protein
VSRETDSTTAFRNLLRIGTKGGTAIPRFLSPQDLRELVESARPYNPLERCDASQDPISHYALSTGFDLVLRHGALIEWDEIRQAAARLIREIEKCELDRDSAREETRWLPLERQNGMFDYLRWVSAWTRRDLEMLLSLFTEDATYEDITLGGSAEGKAELRGFFSTLFHSSDLDMTVRSARYDVIRNEVEAEWERSGSRVPGWHIALNPGGIAVRGRSLLLIVKGKIRSCSDRWNEQDLILVPPKPNVNL